MQTKEITINLETGLYGIHAARFIQLASGFSSTIHIRRNSITLNAKSLLGVLCMELERGTTIQLEADGPDAEKALDCLEAFLRAD